MSRTPTAQEEDRLKKFLADPDIWPMFPRLPLKNVVTGKLGYITCTSLAGPCERPYRLWVGLVFHKYPEERITYQTAEEVSHAGWVVD